MPILFGAIIANLAIILVVVLTSRLGSRRREPATNTSQARIGRAIDGLDLDFERPPARIVTPSSPWDRPAETQPSDEQEAQMPEDPEGPSSAAFLDQAAWESRVTEEDARIRRYHHPATVAVLELDGPGAMQHVIDAVAGVIRRLARDADLVARLDDGRLVVLLPETDEISAINYVERIRAAAESWLADEAVAVRLAIGWAGTTGDPTLPDAQRLATVRMLAELRRGATVPSNG